MFDTIQRLGAIFRPCGDSRVRFGSLNHEGGHATLNIGGFFVSASGLHSWWLDVGRFGALGSFVTSLPTCIQPPFLFGSKKGEQHHEGGSPMSNNTQGNSARNTTIDRITEALDGAIEPGDTGRYLVAISWDGRTTVQTVPDDASVMTIDQLLKAINEPNGRYIETSVLADFAIATMERLKGRDSRIGDMLKELAVTL